MLRPGRVIFITLILILIPFIQSAAQQNPFITTDNSEQASDNSDISNSSSGVAAPLFNTSLMQKIRSRQKSIQAGISGYIAEYRSTKDGSVLFTFLFFSYIYGLLHVLGPGHRKIFLFSYFISSKEKWRRGMAAGFMTAVLHAFSAIILIGGLYLITSKTLLTRFNNITPVIEKISYGTLVVLGAYLVIINIRNYRCGHKGENTVPGTILFVLASGLIPCPGAAAIMIFSLAVQEPLTGIYSILAMSLGMGTILALIPPVAILLQDRLNPVLKKWNPRAGERVHLGVSLTGALIMMMFGLFFLS